MTKRNQQLAMRAIVGVGLGSIIAMAAAAARALRGAGEADPNVTAEGGGRAQPNASMVGRAPFVARAPAEYAVIGERGLFQSTSSARIDNKSEAAQTTAAEVGSPPAAPVAGERVRTPLDDRIAATGVVQINGARHAALEDFGRGDTKFAREGDSAFGYRVARIEEHFVTIERGGHSFRLLLGENKPDRMPLKPGMTTASLDALPAHLQALALAQLPPGGEIRRIRMENLNGETVYRVQKKIDGLDHEIRMAEDGRVLRRESEVRHDNIPPHITAAANGAVEGYHVNRNDTPSLRERDGQRYYQIEMVPADGGKKIDLNIAPDGTVLGKG